MIEEISSVSSRLSSGIISITFLGLREDSVIVGIDNGPVRFRTRITCSSSCLLISSRASLEEIEFRREHS